MTTPKRVIRIVKLIKKERFVWNGSMDKKFVLCLRCRISCVINFQKYQFQGQKKI